MGDEHINIEYQVLFTEIIPKQLRNGHKSTVTIIIYEVDDDKEMVLSNIGTFNFKFNETNKHKVDALLMRKVKSIVNFRTKNQQDIDESFDNIVESFDNET